LSFTELVFAHRPGARSDSHCWSDRSERWIFSRSSRLAIIENRCDSAVDRGGLLEWEIIGPPEIRNVDTNARYVSP
jgi:hypothetical protein